MKNKHPTFVTTTRVDMRVVAQLVLFWEAQGLVITSRNQIIEQTMYAFVDMLTAKDKDSDINNTEYALRILKERGLIKQKPIRNNQTLLKTLSLEDIGQEVKTKTVMSEVDEEEALKILEDLE